MIKCSHLELAFDDWRMLVDFEVKSGNFCALIGPSGAGKSTILNAIAGFIPHGKGQILIDGKDMVGRTPATRPISMLFQDHNLFAHLTIAQNVALGLDPRLKLTKDEWQIVEEALTRAGLENMGKRLPNMLSGGQRQRASLARAILRNRPILLLDEPFAALGPALRKNMLGLVKSISQKANQTVIMVTHHPEDAKLASDHTILVHEGRIAQSGPTQEVFANPSEELSDYLG